MDKHVGGSHIFSMRTIVLFLLVLLASCDANPAALGLTGSTPLVAPPDPGEVQTGIRGAPAVGTQYAPSAGPNTGSGKFWGYN
jgi:hypothetical protein